MQKAGTHTAETLFCSFCGRSEHDVAKLLAGAAGGLICDSCVDSCVQILGRDGQTPGSAGAAMRGLVIRMRGWFGGGSSKLVEVPQ
jgi:hypothetical protein